MTALCARVGLALAALGALSACDKSGTEVVVVVDTDVALSPAASARANELTLMISGAKSDVTFRYGPGQALMGGVATGAPFPTFPATLGIVPGVSGDGPFSVTASLLEVDPSTSQELVVETRRFSNVRFTSGQTRALLVSLPRACLCAAPGTCADVAGDPACADVDAPTLVAFDAAHPPRLAASDGGVTDAPEDAPSDSPAESASPDVAAEAGHDVTEAEVAQDATSDARADATDGPVDATLLMRGYICTSKAQCVSGNCVDGVCCESTCTCGSCTKGTPGVCVPAVAGADPRNACGMYTCDGAGACATTCSGTFGACGTGCKSGSFCDGAGACTVSNSELTYHCIVGSCMCVPGLSCQSQDAGGAGICQ